MKILIILIAFALSNVVEANLLAAAVRGIEPVIISVGTVFAAVSLDDQPHEGAHFWWTEGWKKSYNDW